MRMRIISDETRSAVCVASTFRTSALDVASEHATATLLLAFVLRET